MSPFLFPPRDLDRIDSFFGMVISRNSLDILDRSWAGAAQKGGYSSQRATCSYLSLSLSLAPLAPASACTAEGCVVLCCLSILPSKVSCASRLTNPSVIARRLDSLGWRDRGSWEGSRERGVVSDLGCLRACPTHKTLNGVNWRSCNRE